MSDLLSASEIEARAKAAGGSVRKICDDAKIAVSTFSRWRAGESEPKLGIYQRIVSALRNIESISSLPPEPDQRPQPAADEVRA